MFCHFNVHLQVCGFHKQTPRGIHKLALPCVLELELDGCGSPSQPGGRSGCSTQEEVRKLF